jgi:NitT/TauT family transport system substrate-binding protein
MMKSIAPIFVCCFALMSGCSKSDSLSTTSSGQTSVQLTLDWKPEPEFGGFYAAKQNGAFSKHNLGVNITPAGEGAATWQLVATGKTEFATSTADQVLIARKQNADVIAIFAVYQTFPQGIMVHQARGFKSIGDVFNNDGVLLAENNSWLQFLQKKYPAGKVKIAPYTGGIAQFLAKPDYSQQCFVTSEPILAKRQGADPQTFLIADEGFNPYTTIVICKGDLWGAHPEEVKAMAAACRDGWRDYLDNPDPINAIMHGLNPDMDEQTFKEGAAAQKPLIETDETKANGLGTMTPRRWKELAGQLSDLGVIDSSVDPQQCFVNP